MEIGLALPQYDYSAPGENPLSWATLRDTAVAAEVLGFDSLWLADHLFLAVDKYGGSTDPYDGFDPVVALAGLARCTSKPKLGTLVVCSQLRPAGVLAKQLAAVDVLSGGRVVAGMGAGWFEPEFAAAGIPFRRAGARLEEMGDAIAALRKVWGNEPGSPPCLPPPVQTGGPPIWIGGKGDRLLEVVARHADGWNTVWAWTHENYRERIATLERACAEVGRDPSSITRSVGLYALVGEDERDAKRRFERLKTLSPSGVLADVKYEEWRTGRLVGSVDQVRDQLEEWAAEGVAHLIIGLGAVPFAITTRDDLEMVASAARI